MYSKNYQEKSKLFRCFNYKNIHKAPFPVSKITLFYTVKKDISLKSLIRISAFLELITGQRAFFLRSKKSSIFLKIRKGAPLGVKVNLRNKKLFHFLFRVIWEILPSLKNFYFFFKSCTDLRINISFPSSCKKKELFFINRLLKLPS